MVVTSIKLIKIEPKESGTCAKFNIVFDNILCIHNMRVISGKGGLFVSFPCVPSKEDSRHYFDIVHPLDKSFREEIEKLILEEYNKELDKLQ